jgi:hypothetical protein
VPPNRVIFVNNFARQSLVCQSSAKRGDGGIARNHYQFSRDSLLGGPKPVGSQISFIIYHFVFYSEGGKNRIALPGHP